MSRYRLLVHAPLFIALWLLLQALNRVIDPLWSSYLALVAMYAIALLGMVVLVGLSGQVSLGNGALMAVGAYAFAVSSLNWHTIPFTSIPWNAVWSVIFAGLMGIVFGVVVGWIGARLRGPYLAGLTLGLAVGIPAIASRFTAVLGGNQGLMLTVPYPDGGYGAAAASTGPDEAQAALDAALASPSADLSSVDPGAAPSIDASAAPMSSSDMLTMNDVTGGASVAPTAAAAVPSASPGGSSDMLTAGDVLGGATPVPSAPIPSVAGSADMASAAASAASSPGATATTSDAVGFVLERWQASMAVSVACIAGFLALNLVRGRQGRVWQAVRDDPIAAAVSGISPGGAKVSAFAVSSFFAALSGAVFAQLLAYVGPSAFGIGLSLSLLVGVVLGGRSSLVGAVIGAVIIVLLPSTISHLTESLGWPQQVGANLPTLIYGLLVVLVVLVAPAGVAGLWRRRRR